MSIKKKIWLAVLALVIAGYTGISQQADNTTKAAQENSGEILDEPSWVSGGCDTFWNDNDDNRLCSVGIASGTYNMTSLRLSAQQRAQSYIAGVLEPEVKAIIEHYANSKSGHKDFGNPPDLERARNLAKMLTQQSVLESRIVSVWVPANNRMHVLVSLDITGFHRAVRDNPQLSENLRKELRKRAEKGFKLIKHLKEEKL